MMTDRQEIPTDAPERFFVDKDHSGHWYLIPCVHADEWVDFMEMDEDDERSWDLPEFAKPIDGGPEFMSFCDPKFDY